MTELNKYHLKVGWSKALQRMWSQGKPLEGAMVRKSGGHKFVRKGMRALKLADLPDGKVKLLCLMTRKRADELRKDGIRVDLIAPVERVSGLSRRKAQRGKARSEFTLHDFRQMSEALLESGGKIQTVDNTSQRAEMEQMYWGVVEIARNMERLLKSLPDEDKGGPARLFRDFVDEGKLAKAFLEICLNFYGIDNKAELKGNDKDRMTLIAYLFILVEHEGLGSSIFSEKGVTPFYRFVKEHVMSNVNATSRTLHNRLRGNMATFRKRLKDEPHDSKFQSTYWQSSLYLQNFLKVREIFHATGYYKELEPLLKKAF